MGGVLHHSLTLVPKMGVFCTAINQSLCDLSVPHLHFSLLQIGCRQALYTHNLLLKV